MALTAGLAAWNVRQSLRQYQALESGWSWDLAYYNQWFWALTEGDGRISVRPLGPWTQEGPSIWRMNYLAPVRLAIAPLYHAAPGPRTLLVVQALLFWLVVPAAYGLVASESGSRLAGVAAAALVPLTPLLWPLAWNDFRELQLAPAFVVWAVHGVRARDLRRTVLGVVGMLACREEYAVLVATLAWLPPREPEDVGRRFRWALALGLTGACWFLFGFLGYSRWCVNSQAWDVTLAFLEGSPPVLTRLRTIWGMLGLGLGSWTVLALVRPRAGLLVLPWAWKLAGGLFAMRFLGTEQWHHVRYVVPLVAVSVAAGCIGFGHLARRLLDQPNGRARLAAVWASAAIGLVTADVLLARLMSSVPRRVPAAEVGPLWHWIRQVGPDDGVIAHYSVCAPLSSRRHLYSYVMTQNYPPGYPQLGPEVRWLFYRNRDRLPEGVEKQGFQAVYKGPEFRVLRREDPPVGTAREGRGGDGRERPARKAVPSIDWRGSDGYVYLLGSGFLWLSQALWTTFLLAPAVGLALAARRRAARLEARSASTGVNGRALATRILESGDRDDVRILVTRGPFTNHHDAGLRTLRLSPQAADGCGVVDLAIAAQAAARAVVEISGGPVRRWIWSLREPALFALQIGLALGLTLLAAGAFLLSAQPLDLGAKVISTMTVGLFVMAWVSDREAIRLVRGLDERLDLLNIEERAAVLETLPELAWLSVVPPPLRPFASGPTPTDG